MVGTFNIDERLNYSNKNELKKYIYTILEAMKDLKTLIDSVAIWHETFHIYRAQLMF